MKRYLYPVVKHVARFAFIGVAVSTAVFLIFLAHYQGDFIQAYLSLADCLFGSNFYTIKPFEVAFGGLGILYSCAVYSSEAYRKRLRLLTQRDDRTPLLAGSGGGHQAIGADRR